MARGQTTDETRLGKERNREVREMRQKKEDVATVMSTPAGRRLMYRLIFVDCGLQYVYGGQDNGIHKHEGRRSVGFDYAYDLQTNHAEAYIQMITERMQDMKFTAQIREEPKSIGDES